MGSFQRSWIFTKNSWRVLKLDKEMVTFPILSTLVSLVLFGLYFGIGLFTGAISFNSEGASAGAGIGRYVLGISFYVLSLLIANFYSGALIAAAIKRFDGGDPDVKYGIDQAKQRFGAIAAYSVFSGVIGYLMQILIEKIPFAGKLVVWLANLAWNVANVFSLPVIMTSKEYIGPIDAMKQSVGIIKSTWREAAVANFSLGIIGALVLFGYSIVATTVVTLSLATGIIPITVVLLVVAVAGFFGIVAAISAMTGILKAAIYYYAVTGKAPEQFDHELMEQAFTPKKAKKIFA